MSLGEDIRRGETGPAIEAARRLGRRIHESSDDDGGLEDVRPAFLALLDLRGYLVRTAEDLAGAIQEIRDVGPGFDLYDLSAELCALDDAAVKCRGLATHRRFPELDEFVPPCLCSAESPPHQVP